MNHRSTQVIKHNAPVIQFVTKFLSGPGYSGNLPFLTHMTKPQLQSWG